MILALICDMERGNLEVHNFVFSPPIQGRCHELPGSVESKLTLVNDFYSLGASWLVRSRSIHLDLSIVQGYDITLSSVRNPCVVK